MMPDPIFKAEQPFDAVLDAGAFKYAVRQAVNDRWYIVQIEGDTAKTVCTGAFEHQQDAMNELIEFIKMVNFFRATSRPTNAS